MAASGGYYIACAADYVLANPGTLTGSIGAIMAFNNMEELAKKIGVTAAVIKSGKHLKMSGSPLRAMQPRRTKAIAKCSQTMCISNLYKRSLWVEKPPAEVKSNCLLMGEL